MSTELNETMADLQEEKLLAQLKNVKSEGAGKGRLSLTNKRIEFERKSGLFSTPRREFSVNLPLVSSAEVEDASNTLVLEWFQENSERIVNRLHLPRGDASTNLCRSLNEILDLLRLEAEQQQHRVSYQAFLWKTAYQVWVMAELLLQTVQELTHEDWDAVDASLNKVRETANVLTAEGAIDIADSVQTFTEAVTSRDALLILQQIVVALRAIGTALDDAPPTEEVEDLALESSPGLKWRDIRYIFLFACRYRLLLLWQQLGESDDIEDSLPRLTKLSSIVKEAISKESHPRSLSEEDETPILASSIEAWAQELETSMKTNAGIA